VAGKVVLVTAARRASAWPQPQVCRGGRHHHHLRARPGQARRSLQGGQGQGLRQFIAYAADIADMADCDRFVQLLVDNHGGVDFLINNAGRSIRRAIEASYDRFHDFERTMQLNYFGCLRVTMGLLPGMVAKRKGHVVNISSIGVLTNAPRFSAYVASKAALDAWTRCAPASSPTRASPSPPSTCRWCARP
jgi:NAD(P)-dependent dehydrogenase (short-subunit alcohol dehydrogenase family)